MTKPIVDGGEGGLADSATPTVGSSQVVHLDLFSGIGGFAYAADQVWDNVEHIFCDNDKFCQQVLKKHWPEAKIYGDIRTITNTTIKGLERKHQKRKYPLKNKTGQARTNGSVGHISRLPHVNLLTGGFPCQPYSAAGLRRGTADERHLWPEMLRVIRLTKPTWVIAENVRGLLTWNEGMVFEQVCADMEAEGYSVQPLIIPAVAVNAPHRRDRIWFVAHRRPNTNGHQHRLQKPRPKQQATRYRQFDEAAWDKDWTEVAAEFCSVDDGLPARVGRLELSKSQHRKEQLKAYGNAIVPQIAVEIMKGMK